MTHPQNLSQFKKFLILNFHQFDLIYAVDFLNSVENLLRKYPKLKIVENVVPLTFVLTDTKRILSIDVYKQKVFFAQFPSKNTFEEIEDIMLIECENAMHLMEMSTQELEELYIKSYLEVISIMPKTGY